MAKHANLRELFTAIANSIRGKTGGTDAIIADDFPEAIDGIQAGGGVDKIQRWIDLNGGSTKYMFYYFVGSNVDELLEGVDTSRSISAHSMFGNCNSLTSVPLFNTSSVMDMDYMFYNCSKLLSVPEFDMRKASSASNMFYNCVALTECWIRNIKVSLQVGNGSSWGHLLTLESLLHLCKECIKVGYSRTLTVGTANLEKLANVYVKLIPITDDMRSEDDLIDEKYPFVQCESTDDGAMTIQDYMALKMWTLA